MTEIKPGTPLPATAGVCAYDRDECTVTLALDSEADVVALVNALPAKHRVKLCEDDAADNFHLLNGLREARGKLENAAKWFRDYERQHRAKATQEGDLKADVNGDRATFLEEAIANLDTLLSQEGGQ